MQTKRCKKCGEIKDVSEFYPQRQYGDNCWHSYCIECHKIRNKEYAQEHRFQIAINQSRCAAKRKGYEKCHATASEIRELYIAQDGRCAICGFAEDELKRKLCLDHNHETGAARGWLCEHCNKGIGHLQDSETLLFNAFEYLVSSS